MLGAEGLRGHPAEGQMRSEGVEPVGPFRGRDLNVIEALPRSEVPDHFGFEQRVQGLGQRVVIGVTS